MPVGAVGAGEQTRKAESLPCVTKYDMYKGYSLPICFLPGEVVCTVTTGLHGENLCLDRFCE